jgi:hypothetical protein
MPTPRTPTALLEAKGSFVEHPARARPSEPTNTHPLGSPSPQLSLVEKRVWRDMVKRACPGVLFESDRDHFELCVRLCTKMRYNFDKMNAAEMSQFISLGSRFAMTPADRSRVTVAAAPKSNLQSFLAQKPKPQLVVNS